MTSGTHVRIQGVRKSYGGVAALAGLDLELELGSPDCWGRTGPARPP
jgi:ABC-type sugar transport system ATPase subunit